MPSLKKNEGFSLVEVLVSITILAVGLLGVASMQTTAISGNFFAQTGTEGVQLAQEMVDLIRTNGGSTPQIYNDIDTSGSCSGSEPALTDCTNWKANLQNSGLQNISGSVEVATDTPVENAATITVKVNWGATGNNRNVTLTTILETRGT